MPATGAAAVYLPYMVGALGLAYSASQAYQSTKGNQNAGTKDPLAGRQVNTRSSREPLIIPYGQFRTGVNKTFLHVANPYLHMICEIGEGEINGIVREDGSVYSTTATQLTSTNPPLVYLDDKIFTDYGSSVYIEFFPGSSSQNVCSTLQSSTSKWDQTLRYTSYLYVRLKFDPEKFNSEPNITLEMQGLKIYNPVTAATAYSNNAALCSYDFVTRSSARGGIGVSADRISTPALSTSIDYCDTKGWTCNMPINRQQPVADNLQLIFNNFRGDIIQSADLLKIKFKDLNHESVVMSLGESDVIRSPDGFSTLEISQPDAGRRPNAVRATHLSSEKQYKPDDVIVSDATAISTEGDLREQKIDVLGLSEPELVQKMCNYYLERLRLNKTITFTASSKAMALEPLDLVYFDHTMPGWDDKILRVESCPINGDHTVSLTLIEENTTFYDDTYNLTAHDWDSTSLPSPLDAVPSVINVSQDEEVYYYRNRSFTRWKIDFDEPAAADYPWWDYAEIWLKIGSAGDWRYMTRCDTNYQVDPVEEGETYYIKVRSVSIFGLKEDFDSCTTLSTTIVGVTSAPSSLSAITAIANGDSVSIYGTPLTDPDIEGYEIRLGDSWDGGIFVSFNKNISLRLNGVRPGTHTFWAAAKDNAGNYSSTPVSATVTVFIPPGFSQLATYGSWAWDFTTGTFSNTEHTTYDSGDALKCSHTAGVLVGTWTSPDYDLNSVVKIRAWGDFISGLESSDTTWDGVLPLVTSGSELITDGDFNNWTADDLDSWSESNCDAAEDVAGVSGSAAQITITADNYGIYQDVTVVAETWYILRGQYKNTAGDVAKYYVYDSDNAQYLTIDGGEILPDSTAFDAFNFIFKTPAGCTSIRIWLCAATNGDIVWYDSVSLFTVDDANSTTWADIDSGSDKTWSELFEPVTAAQLQATLRYKQLSGDAWSEIDYFELLCAEVEARYISVVVTITDPSLDSNLYLKTLNMLAYTGPQ